MKIFKPLQILHAVSHSRGCTKMSFLKVAALVAMVTTTAFSRPEALFSYKNVARKE